MYLARFDAEGMMLAQGAVAVQGDPGNDAGAGLWSAQLDSLADALKTLAYQCLAVRLQASPEGKFQRLVAVTVTADHTDTLCTWIASFTRFDRVVDGAVIIPADRVQFDALLGAVSRLSSCLLPEALQTAEGAWLAVPSRIQPFLADLFEEASLFGHELTYQAHLIPSEGKVEDLRSARKNLLRLEHTAGIPRVLLEAQRARVSEFARATTEVEEFVAVDTPEAAAWLRKALSRRLAANWAASGVAAPEVVVEAVRYRDVLSGALHQALVVAQAPATVDRRTAAAADDTFQHQLLTWRPRSPLVTMPAGRSGADIGQPSLALRPIKTRWTVVPYEGDESFLCISYSHADAERLTKLGSTDRRYRLASMVRSRYPGRRRVGRAD